MDISPYCGYVDYEAVVATLLFSSGKHVSSRFEEVHPAALHGELSVHVLIAQNIIEPLLHDAWNVPETARKFI